MTKKPTLINSIRAKLISAVAMLLVAVIMVVSSTYAWFTLSTAPEITGITTAIGANGALEMALRYGTTDAPREGILISGTDANTYWGNLVDLKTTDAVNYGVGDIVLLPSMLNVDGDTLQANMLKTPVYGPDGRVSDVSANTFSGLFKTQDGKSAFYNSSDFGFRGIGVASGLTDRQLAYRQAKATASTANTQAKNAAAASLSENGSVLANIALKKATSSDAKYNQADIAALLAVVDDLLGKDGEVGAVGYVERAYMYYILAYAAGSAGGNDDLKWTAVKNAVEAENATLQSVIATLEQHVALPSDVKAAVEKLTKTKTDVAAAKVELEAMASRDNITWDELTVPLYNLANIDKMMVNGYTPGEVKANMNALVQDVASGKGIIVSMATGGGVYADIADHCGDYNASVQINKVEYNGLEIGPLNARMETKSTVAQSADGHYLNIVNTKLQTESPEFSSGNDAEKPLTEFYGYVIDLSFRTNATESNLLLQTEAVDRIYGDNANEQTMGGGSSMTFKSTSADFTDDQVKNLMKHIRIVFFTPGTDASQAGTVLAYAKLDTEHAVVGADGVTANMYLVEVVEDEVVYVYTDASDAVKYVEKDGKFYDSETATEALETAPNVTGLTKTKKVLSTKETLITEKEKSVITALTQNATTNVSALVYLDGTTMTNADVAYNTATSMTGKTNFQFSSSATLVPMEYANLHTPGAGSETTAAPVTPEEP